MIIYYLISPFQVVIVGSLIVLVAAATVVFACWRRGRRREKERDKEGEEREKDMEECRGVSGGEEEDVGGKLLGTVEEQV